MEQENKKQVLSGAIIIAVISLYAYLITFLYEIGFLLVYNLPFEFANLSLVNTFIVGGSLLTTFTILIAIANSVFAFFAPIFRKKHPLLELFKKLSPIYILLALLIYLFGSMWKEWLWALIMALFYTAIQLIFPLFGKHDEKYFERMERQLEEDGKQESIFDFLLFLLPRPTEKNKTKFLSIIKLAVVLVFLIILAFFAGRANALKKQNYFVLETNPEMVAIKITNSSVVLLPFDRNSKSLRSEFKVVDLKDLTAPLKSEKLGNLTIKK